MPNSAFYIGLDDFLLSTLREDVGTGDITTLSCVPAGAASHGRFVAKEAGVLCGGPILAQVFKLVDTLVHVKLLIPDGDTVEKGDVIATIDGPSRSILTGERTALNILQHLSGVATRTAEAVKQTEGYDAKISDTRKTTPGMRILEKYAVRCGGGTNHRFNLSDGVLIKDNHISAAGSIAHAIRLARRSIPHTLKIEVETESMDQVREALSAGADIIMLDNMTVEQMTEAVKFIDGRALTEASGNMGDRDIATVAATGVDIISIGALTHSVRALDISLKFDR